MYRVVNWLTIVLATLLPWHGAVTVFLPEPLRWWKEVVILFLVGAVLWSEFRAWHAGKKFLMSAAEIFALLFLVWGIGLAGFSTDPGTAAIAMRYLGLAMFVYLVWSLWFQNPKNSRSQFLKRFAGWYLPSCLLAVLFGTWVTHGGGESFVQFFYSTTLSSWVPGQTIPLWHEIAGVARLQGASSGPIEFSHLLLAALALLPLWRIGRVWQILAGIIFLVGIWMSASRAAILGSVVIVGWQFLQLIPARVRRATVITGVVVLAMATGWLAMSTTIFERAGTTDHWTRPVAALRTGISAPIAGHLGEWGPAARAQNLEKNNDDRAPIAENVLADWWVQLGLIGFLFGLGWLAVTFKRLDPRWYGWGLSVLLTINLATVWDMTPIAIGWGTLLAAMRRN